MADTSILQRAAALAFVVAAASTGSVACRSSEGDPKPSAAPAAEPLHFTFSLPSQYSPLELSGEGSETLRAPPGARVTRADGVVRVEAGADFAIEIAARPKPLSELTAAIAVARRRLEEKDLVVFDAAAGHAFVSVRELVPEWDENDRRQFSCNSVGALSGAPPGGADVRGFSKAAVQDMVAACRTLELPRLE